MADETDTNWKAAYNALERQCKSASNRAGRDLAAFAVGSALTSAAAYGFYRWRKSQHACACEAPESGAENDGSDEPANGSNGNGDSNGNGNPETKKATINPAGLPNQGNQGGMMPGDS